MDGNEEHQSSSAILNRKLTEWRKEVKTFLLKECPIMLLGVIITTSICSTAVYLIVGHDLFIERALYIVVLVPIIFAPPVWFMFPRKPTIHEVQMDAVLSEIGRVAKSRET